MSRKYFLLRRSAVILCDNGGYNLAASEMNPVIFEDFVDLLMERCIHPVIWEPFAGRTTHSPFQDYAKEAGVLLLSQTLHPQDSRIVARDSTEVGPSEKIGGMLFHPPYFGPEPIIEDSRDVCSENGEKSYLHRLRITACLARRKMVKNALVCAVGRDYRIGGRRIRLDLWYLNIFESERFVLDAVWTSEPDVVLIFRKGE